MSGVDVKSLSIHASVRPAVRWFFRLRDAQGPELAPAELQEWERFAADPAHRRELAQIKELWQTVKDLGGPREPTQAELDADDFDGSVPIAQWLAYKSREKRTAWSKFGRPVRFAVLAAGLSAVIVGIGLFAVSWLDSRPQGRIQTFATPRAETRAVTLADGSVITLGALTQIHARITPRERAIVLDRGEAWFKVAHENGRPFRVLAGRGVITAVGTEFNVRRDLGGKIDRVTVTVGDGAVRVEPQGDTRQNSGPAEASVAQRAWATTKLEKGQELTYDDDGVRGEVKLADIEAAAAWKEGRLEYIHEPLRAVVASVNRYSEKPIVLSDKAVGEIDYCGTVFEDQVDEWVEALRAAFPVSVIETHDRILIRSHASEEAHDRR